MVERLTIGNPAKLSDQLPTGMSVAEVLALSSAIQLQRIAQALEIIAERFGKATSQVPPPVDSN